VKGLAPRLVCVLLFVLLLPESPAAVEGAAPSQQPQRTAVFVSGTGGYHTYRIPALLVTKKGTLLAFCEGRRKSRSDSGDIACLYEAGQEHPYEKIVFARFSLGWLTGGKEKFDS